VALVFAALHRRTRLPLLQADPRLDYGSPPQSGGSRPLELADRWRLLAVVAGPLTRQRGPPALGASPTGWLAHPRPSPAPLHRNIGPGGYSGSRTSQARKITRTSDRTTSKPSTPLPSGPAPSTARRLISQFLVQTSISNFQN
jgi:hypothetical protein